ncbi:MAG: IS4 family transposase [Clostridiales bacterium]|nr:IS4 family transposase [Clostridiales bacterium]
MRILLKNEKNHTIFNKVESFIFAPATREKYKTIRNAFTRNRKLPFELLILSLLNMPKRTLSIELYAFFNYIGKGIGRAVSITTSAFTQRRKKLSPDVFEGINQVILEEYYTDNDERVTLWNGHRLLSIDGSYICLPYSEELKNIYGTHNNQNKTEDVILGRVSVLYDVLNNIVLEGFLLPKTNGEITIAHEHIKQLYVNDLVILDRGYPSFALAYEILEKGSNFLFRCKHEYNNVTEQFMASDKQEDIVEIKSKQKQSFKGKTYTKDSTIQVRLIKIPLDNGEIELLMTSLIDREKYPCEYFKELYSKRWGIETYYDRLKNILNLENFSGLTNQAILQDFQCALFISNVQSLILEEAQQSADKKYGKRKYEYKINSSVSLGFLKYRILDLFIKKGAKATLEELEKILIEQVVPVRKGRKFKREPDKYRQRTKPPMFHNRKKLI